MLDSEQNKIASHYGSNLLVLAGAGSGKTATVTQRGARLVKAGLDPRRALMMTFTNKAAKEMKSRMIEIFTDEHINADIPNITTYHQFGYRLIKKNFEKLYFQHGMPTILSEKDALSEWVNAYLKVDGLSNDTLKNHPVHRSIPDTLANKALILDNNSESIDSIRAFFLSEPELEPFSQELLEAVLNYTEFKYEQNVLDFNDMIILPIKLLRNNPDIAKSISNYLHDVVIDESQDNNQAQYELLKLITDCGKVPTMMIGDGDQSIYEWRGATPSNLERFLKEFNASKFVLERNYRSNSDIVMGAQSLVSNNVKRIEKHAFSERLREEQIESSAFFKKDSLSNSILYTRSEHAYELGRQIAKHLKEYQEKGGDLSEVAVLYRSQRMGYFMDKSLRENGIPTVMMTGTGLMERREALLSVAALRLKSNPFDQNAFKRIALTIPGFGEKSISGIIETAKEKKLPVLTANLSGLNSKQTIGLKTVQQMIEKLETPEQILDWVKENLKDHLLKLAEDKVKQDIKSGKLSSDFKEKEDLFNSKVHANYLNFINTVETIKKSIDNQISEKDYQDNIWEVITDLSLDAPQSKKEAVGVKLSTVHSFKGLEAKEVHIAGYTDGIMPLRDKEGAIDNPEEERRLAYVAITRAKENLFIHHLKNYDPVTGGYGSGAKSMRETIYIKEMVEGLIEHEDSFSLSR